VLKSGSARLCRLRNGRKNLNKPGEKISDVDVTLKVKQA
jgi:hypothetical protein